MIKYVCNYVTLLFFLRSTNLHRLISPNESSNRLARSAFFSQAFLFASVYQMIRLVYCANL